jgi:hypothetical protein
MVNSLVSARPLTSGTLNFLFAVLIPLVVKSLTNYLINICLPSPVQSRHSMNNEYMNEWCYFISEPPFLHLQNGVINSPYLTGLV